MSLKNEPPNTAFRTEYKTFWDRQARKEKMPLIPWIEKTLNLACKNDPYKTRDMPEWLGIFTAPTADRIFRRGIKSFDELRKCQGRLHKMGFYPYQIEEINDKI